MNPIRRRQLVKSVFTDYITAGLSVAVFNLVRFVFNTRYAVINEVSLRSYMLSPVPVIEVFVFPLLMLALYWLSGSYSSVMTRSRLKDFINSLCNALAGSLIFFFVAMLNDLLPMRRLNYELILIFFVILTVFVTMGRWAVSNSLHRRRRKGLSVRRALIVGTSPDSVSLRDRLHRSQKVMGIDVIGFVRMAADGHPASCDLQIYEESQIADMLAADNIDALIIPSGCGQMSQMQLVNRFLPLDVSVFVSPDNTTLSVARKSFDNVAGEPLVDMSRPPMNAAWVNVKRVIDVVVSSVALVVLSPLLAAIAIAVKTDSPGPVFYRQRRLGYHRRPFDIVKFRSMRADAELASGPALSSPDDKRITRVGHILRKYRLDELPNFWNVLRGDMSLVGPRPEREHFLRLIMEKAPQCTLLHRVRPGITSWGMVKYGYAQTVDEMVERLRYDLLYVENISLTVDIKILFYTVHTVITGKGI